MSSTLERRLAVRAARTLFLVILTVVLVAPAAGGADVGDLAAAADPATSPGIEEAAASQAAATPTPALPFENPWMRRPVCSNMFLKSDWPLTKKQRACDWIHNRLFSNTALIAAGFSAEVSKIRDAPSERGDGLGTRFARRYAQSALKSLGTYIGTVIADEDPRVEPRY